MEKTSEKTVIEKDLIDDIIENQKEQMAIDVALTKEAAEQIAGFFDPLGIYNIPRKSSGIGAKKDWGAICDAVHCPHKGKEDHIHTLGVGIAGAKRAMNIYGNLEIIPKPPKIVTEDGIKYWMSEVSGIDGRNKNKVTLTYMQSASMLTRDGREIKNEFMPMVVQSKCIRNVIMFLVPGSISQKWIEEYIQGNTKEEPGSRKQKVLDDIKDKLNGFSTIDEIDKWLANQTKLSESKIRKEIEALVEARRKALTPNNEKTQEQSMTRTEAVNKIVALTNEKVADVNSFVSDRMLIDDSVTLELLAGNADAIPQFKRNLHEYLQMANEQPETEYEQQPE